MGERIVTDPLKFYGDKLMNSPTIDKGRLELACKSLDMAVNSTNPGIQERALNLAAERERAAFG